MRLLGIRYYMAYTPEAVQKADTQTELTKVGTSGPWHVYELATTSLVEPLTVQPVVVNPREGDPRERWLEIGTSYFQHEEEWNALPVADGPKEWQEINVEADTDRKIGEEGQPGRLVDIVVPTETINKTAIEPTKVSNVVIGTESVSFSVDKIGTPVLVKVSYFPNWKVKGAQAVYRAAPNMMVVVPTNTNVSLSYEPSRLDRSSYLLTFLGLVLVVFMFRRRVRYGTAMPPSVSEGSSVAEADTDNLSS
jgi:hypothetical protein